MISILIPSVYERRDTFLPKILNQLEAQYNFLSVEDKEKVEILTLIDNKKTMVGEKRNIMLFIAQGDYVVFVDDDDRISDDYIKTLLEATKTNSDIITFKAEVSLNGEEPKECIYSMDFETDQNKHNKYYRLPNHICCIKREIALSIKFPSVVYGEDSAYSKLLKPILKTQTFIDKTLYYYDYNDKTTIKQNKLEKKRLWI